MNKKIRKQKSIIINGKKYSLDPKAYTRNDLVANMIRESYEQALDDNHIIHGKAADDFIKRMKAQEGKKISKKQQKFLDECVKQFRGALEKN